MIKKEKQGTISITYQLSPYNKDLLSKLKKIAKGKGGNKEIIFVLPDLKKKEGSRKEYQMIKNMENVIIPSNKDDLEVENISTFIIELKVGIPEDPIKVKDLIGFLEPADDTSIIIARTEKDKELNHLLSKIIAFGEKIYIYFEG